MRKSRIYSLTNIKENLGDNKEKIEDLMCHNNCKVVYDHLIKDNSKKEFFIVGGWMWRFISRNINASYHFSIFDGNEFYDTIEGFFLPLFKVKPSDWRKDQIRLSMCSYYVNNGLEQIEKDVTELYESIQNDSYDLGMLNKHKMETINGILLPTIDHLKYVNSSKNEDDFQILDYKKLILDF